MQQDSHCLSQDPEAEVESLLVPRHMANTVGPGIMLQTSNFQMPMTALGTEQFQCLK